jgi:purine-binding chemotaxis protein CheW
MKHERTGDRSRAGVQLITFRLGAEYYGIYVSKVREILRPIDLFAVPGMGERIDGVINLRGEIIPIVKIDLLLGIRISGGEDANRKRRMIIIDAVAGSFGFFVDEVLEVTRIQREDVQAAPAFGPQDPHTAVVTGIAKISGRMVVCIDPEKIIPDDIMAKEIEIGA